MCLGYTVTPTPEMLADKEMLPESKNGKKTGSYTAIPRLRGAFFEVVPRRNATCFEA